MNNVYNFLKERGLIAQETHAQMDHILSMPLTAYIGFDPTADSLHVGSLIPLRVLHILKQYDHNPIPLIGSSTACIGDPSGKSESRKMLTLNEISNNSDKVRCQMASILNIAPITIVNNMKWWGDANWIEILRDIGKHFSVNHMLSMESVKGRMEKGGISFLEFNYMIMQAYDFVYLHNQYGCKLQLGGSDQWGNIIMGLDLARKSQNTELFGITFPLLTKSNGTKFGKTEEGNIWLDKNKTSVYDFFQFFRNTDDKDVEKFMRFFTDIPLNDITSLTQSSINEAKRILAHSITQFVHGKDEADKVNKDCLEIFSNKKTDVDSLPIISISKDSIDTGVSIVDLLIKTAFVKSKSDAKRLIQGKAVRIMDTVITDPLTIITNDVLDDEYFTVKVGKTRIFRFYISP